MLTTFRKIRKSLLGSGQASRYLLYAIGEITLVVIGILIALQVNNWNESKKRLSKEKVILADLEQNIETNIEIEGWCNLNEPVFISGFSSEFKDGNRTQFVMDKVIYNSW